MFRGNVINSANLTIFGDATTLGLISFGLTAPTSAAGNFDVSPTFNVSASGLYLIYNPETAPRTTGTEVPANRTLYFLDINNPQGVTLAGENITVAGASSATVPALSLVAGIVTTSPANTLIIGSASTIAPTGSATSYVKGPLGITVNSTTPVSRTFAVGDAAGWRPVVIGGITTTTPQLYTATVINGATGGTVSGPISSLNPTRYVRIENTTNLPATATVQLSYGTDDVIGAPATAVIAQAPTATGIYASIGGALATVPTTGIVSTQNITPGNDFFVIANTEGGTLASSTATVCAGTNTGTITLTGLATGASITGYEANTGAGFTAVSGTNTNPTYTFSNLAGTTTFRAVITTSDARTVFSAPVTVTVTPTPSAAFSYGTVTSVCQSATAAVSPTITGAAGGTFTSTTGLSINATTGAITPSTSTAGTYTVTYSVSGTCPNSATQTITITAPGTATFSYPAAGLCATSVTPVAPTLGTGSTAGTFTSTTGLTINATTGAITPSTSTAGTYTVTNTIPAAGGCAAVTSTAQVIINAAPATPTITQTGGTLTSSSATGNQWFLNGVAITGATNQTYVTTANGNYTVVVTANNCASATSAVRNVTNTGVKDALAGMSVNVYPNPAKGSFNVKLSGYQKDATVILYNLAGQQITTEKVAADGQAKNIDIKGLAAGTYLLKVTSEKGVQMNRLIVQ